MELRTQIALALCLAALLVPASVAAAASYGTPAQVAWVRRAATNFVTAELARDGAGACAILNAPLRATLGRRTCAQRWDSRLAALLRRPGARARLRAQRRAVAAAEVHVHGNLATLTLHSPLIAGPNHFLWTENCWMLTG